MRPLIGQGRLIWLPFNEILLQPASAISYRAYIIGPWCHRMSVAKHSGDNRNITASVMPLIAADFAHFRHMLAAKTPLYPLTAILDDDVSNYFWLYMLATNLIRYWAPIIVSISAFMSEAEALSNYRGARYGSRALGIRDDADFAGIDSIMKSRPAEMWL